MYYLRRFALASAPDVPRIGVRTDRTEQIHDLTAADPNRFATMASLLALENPVAAIADLLNSGGATHVAVSETTALAPVDTQEVWASGVTYLRSKVARMEESKDAGGGDFYDRVYDADRPELFFKSAAARVVPPGGDVRIRRDSTWDVPEPELTLVLSSRGQIVGLCVGNDMSSRSIEGVNPLYLPQAKTYNGSCSLSTEIRLIDDNLDIHNLAIQLTISRSGGVVFTGNTATSQMRRKPAELAEWLFRELSFPQGVFLMTGTGIIPEDDFTLQPGDVVRITIAGVGELINTVTR